MKLYIKILSGTQEGASLETKADEHISFGNADGCNVFLYHDSPDAVFFEAEIEEQSVIIKHLNSTIKDGDDSLVSDGQKLALPCFIDVNGIRLGLGYNAVDIDSWPELIPQVNFDDASDQEPEFDNYGDQQSIPDNLTAKTKTGLFLAKSKHQALELLDYLKKNLTYLTKRLRGLSQTNKPAFYAIVAFMLLIFLVFISICVTPGNKAVKPQQTTTVDLGIKKIISNLPARYSNLLFNQASGGKFILTGVVDNTNDLIELKRILVNYQSILTYQVITAADLLKITQVILQNAQLSKIKMNYDYEQHRLQLSGVTKDMNQLNDAEVEISSKQAMANDIDSSQVYDLQQLQDDVNSFITANQVPGRLQPLYQLELNTVTFSGYLSKIEMNNIKNKLSNLQDKYKIISFKLDIKDEVNALPFKIYSIYIGNPGYITTENGTNLFVGGELDGFRLVSLSNDKVVFMGKVELVFTPDQLVQSSLDNRDTDSQPESGGGAGNNNRSRLLQQEYEQTSLAIPKDRAQIKKLQNLKLIATDHTMVDFINSQINEIESDLIYKQEDLDNLKQILKKA